MLINPDFFILGAQKAGTTSLFHYLNKHPKIFFPKLKEPKFFNKYGLPNKETFTIEEYSNLYSEKAADQVSGDASPSYLTSPNARRNIKQHCGEHLKFIVILRHPVDRAYSNYQHARREGLEANTSFEEAIREDYNDQSDQDSNFKNYIWKSLYSKHLKAYFELFDKKEFLILINEEFKVNPELDIKAVLDHIGLELDIQIEKESRNQGRIPRFYILRPITKFYYRNFARPLRNKLPTWVKKAIKNLLEKKVPKLDSKLRKKLTQEYFEEDIKELQKLLNRDFSNWLC